MNGYISSFVKSKHSGSMLFTFILCIIFSIFSIILYDSTVDDIKNGIAVVFFLATAMSIIYFFIALGHFMQNIYNSERRDKYH